MTNGYSIPLLFRRSGAGGAQRMFDLRLGGRLVQVGGTPDRIRPMVPSGGDPRRRQLGLGAIPDETTKNAKEPNFLRSLQYQHISVFVLSEKISFCQTYSIVYIIRQNFSYLRMNYMVIGIMCHTTLGGSSRIACALCLQLVNRGHVVHLFVRTAPLDYEFLEENGVKIHFLQRCYKTNLEQTTLDTEWDASLLRKYFMMLLEIAGNQGLDILHFHYALPFAFVAAELKRTLGPRCPLLVGTLHGTDVSYFGNSTFEGVRLSSALEQLDALTTVSRSHADLATCVFNLHHRPRVIPNFIDSRHFRPKALPTGWPGHGLKKRYTVIHMSNFRAVKDPDRMLHIFKGIIRTIDAELWLIGDGPELERVKRSVDCDNLGNRVNFFGIVNDVAPILSQGDLFLLTSKTESFSLSAVEAMACGVPVLAPAVGGLPEVIDDCRTGFLFNDAEDAIRIAIHYFSHSQRFKEFSDNSIQHARQYDQSTIVPLYEKLYASLIAKKVYA